MAVCQVQPVTQIRQLFVSLFTVAQHPVIAPGQKHLKAAGGKKIIGGQGVLEIQLLFKSAVHSGRSAVFPAVAGVKNQDFFALVLDRGRIFW